MRTRAARCRSSAAVVPPRRAPGGSVRYGAAQPRGVTTTSSTQSLTRARMSDPLYLPYRLLPRLRCPHDARGQSFDGCDVAFNDSANIGPSLASSIKRLGPSRHCVATLRVRLLALPRRWRLNSRSSASRCRTVVVVVAPGPTFGADSPRAVRHQLATCSAQRQRGYPASANDVLIASRGGRFSSVAAAASGIVASICQVAATLRQSAAAAVLLIKKQPCC
jgi:hypothetical protein